jgi:AcrR family transcriptional regulator
MSKKKTTKRKYDSSRRQIQARETKLKVVEAAHTLFLEQGYAGATIESIAKTAGVAKETVYSIFRNKRNILAFLLDVSAGGDDQPVRIIDRPGPQAVMHNTDQHQQIKMFSNDISEIMNRAGSVFEVMQVAAKSEPEIGKRLQHLHEERLGNLTNFVHHVSANGPLRDNLDETIAGETVWALASPELFNLLTGRLGWSRQKYAEWLADALHRILLP